MCWLALLVTCVQSLVIEAGLPGWFTWLLSAAQMLIVPSQIHSQADNPKAGAALENGLAATFAALARGAAVCDTCTGHACDRSALQSAGRSPGGAVIAVKTANNVAYVAGSGEAAQAGDQEGCQGHGDCAWCGHGGGHLCSGAACHFREGTVCPVPPVCPVRYMTYKLLFVSEVYYPEMHACVQLRVDEDTTRASRCMVCL